MRPIAGEKGLRGSSGIWAAGWWGASANTRGAGGYNLPRRLPGGED
ncbi:MAG: hypothetical protein HUU24_09220 [Phycisphaerae bacterium]|nr:hypothetical protein [Phycisphaerae bacterium]